MRHFIGFICHLIVTEGSVILVSALKSDDNAELQAAILKDFFAAIPISPKCIEGSKSATTNIERTFNSQVASYFDEKHLKHEKDLFLLSMSDPAPENKNQTWTFRVGSGGNIYSFIGAYGEAIPPQRHDDAPWIDEIWQCVTVDVTKPRKPYTYDIHQAGAYHRDDLPKPFYAPNLAVHCERNYCLVASHGTHAHIPTIFSNSIIYFTRYANCGKGAIEVTNLVYNTKYSAIKPEEVAPKVNYLVVPWGGVRRSTLQDMIITEPGEAAAGEDDIWKVIKPLPPFKSAPKFHLSKTAGYTIFAQSVKNPELPKFEMPAAEVEVNEDESPGDRKDEADDGDVCVSHVNSTDIRKPHQARERKVRRKRLLRIIAKTNTPFSETGRKTVDGKTVYRMALARTAPVGDGHHGCPLHFKNSRTKSSFVVDSIIRWSGDGTAMLFVSQSKPEQLNKMIQKDDELHVSYFNAGKRKDDNLALSHVHGRDQRDKKKFDNESFARYGTGGGSQRDFSVLSIINKDDLEPGELWYKRQYYVTDSLSDIGRSSRKWNYHVYKDRLDEKQIFNDLPDRQLHLFASRDMTTIGISMTDKCRGSKLVCTGSTTPTRINQGQMLYSILCGAETYNGSHLYHFSRPIHRDSDLARLHECKGLGKAVLPKITFLGFFQEGSCSQISKAKYDPMYCISTDDRAFEFRDEF